MSPQKTYLDEQGNPVVANPVYLDDSGNPLSPEESQKAGWLDILPMTFQRIVSNLTAGGRTVTTPEEFPPIAPLQQYSLSGPVFGPDKTVSERVVNAIPVVGPSINEAIRQYASGQPAEATATLTADVLAPALIAKTPSGAALRKSATKNWMKVLEPTSRNAVGVAEQISPGLAETRTVAATRGSLQKKLAAGKAEYGPQTGTAFAKEVPMELGEYADALNKVREQHVYIKGTKTVRQGRKMLDEGLKSIENDMQNLADPSTGQIPAQIVDNFIDDLNQGLVNAKGEFAQVAPKVKRMIDKSAARNLRVMLDEPRPSAARINAMYRMYAEGWKLIENSRTARITAESAMKSGSSKGFGAALKKALPAPIREMPNAVSNIFDSVAWHTVSAASKNKIADMLTSGNFRNAQLAMAVLMIPSGSREYDWTPAGGLVARGK